MWTTVCLPNSLIYVTFLHSTKMVPHSYVGKPSFHKKTIEIPDVDSLRTAFSNTICIRCEFSGQCSRLGWTKNWPTSVIRYVGIWCKLLVAVAAQTLSCDARVYLTSACEEIIAYHVRIVGVLLGDNVALSL